jgi:tRNA(His) 5'-end guanylyltransferase
VYGDFIGVRIDGKAFHTYTKAFEKPFDSLITEAMDFAVYNLCRNTDVPVLFAYTQSDEISLLLRGQGWFHDTQKISSIVASYTTAFFNRELQTAKPAVFDARVFSLKREEVVDYFKWRKMDANRNAISAVAQSLYSHNELQSKSKAELLDLIGAKSPKSLPIPDRNFNGAYFYPIMQPMPVEYFDKRTQRIESTVATRRVWYKETDNGMLDHLLHHVVD